MKKLKLVKMVGTIALVTVMSASTVFAATTALKKVTGYENPAIKVTVDGKAVAIKDSADKVVYPVNINGSNYVPLKSISDITGKSVTYDSKTKTVIIGTKNVPNWVKGFPKYSGDLAKITNKKFLEYTHEKTDLNQFEGLMMTQTQFGKEVGKIKVKDTFSCYLVATGVGDEIFRPEDRYIEISDKNEIVLSKISYSNKEFDIPQYIELDGLGENELTIKVGKYWSDGSINCMIINPITMIDTNN